MLEKVTITVNRVFTPPKPSILCIDDSPGMLMICRAILEANGYSVLTALGAETGLEILENNVVNAAVIDDGLKEIDATSLVRKIRKASPRLPVVVFMRSSYPSGATSEREIYVAKSSGPKALLAAIVRACKVEPETPS